MKFIVSSGALLKQLSSISGVIPSNPIVPILENFLFNISNGDLTISASDLQVSMTTHLNVEATENCSIAIPAKYLLEIIRNLPEQPLTLTIDEKSNKIEIKSFNGVYRLTGENADDFPRIPQPDVVNRMNFSSEILISAISNTIFAISNDELRLAMTGLYFKMKDKKATFVSTDGHRLIKYERMLPAFENDSFSVILPKKAVSLLKASLPDQITDLQAEISSNNAFFTFGNIRMVCRLIDENFPDYENAIPLNNANVMTINRQEILNSLKRIIIFANKTTSQIRLKMEARKLQILAEDLDFSNDANETLSCEYKGEEMEIGFNGKFLVEMISNLSAEEINFTFSTPNKAAIVLPKEKSEEEDILMLIMPVMLSTYA